MGRVAKKGGGRMEELGEGGLSGFKICTAQQIWAKRGPSSRFVVEGNSKPL